MTDPEPNLPGGLSSTQPGVSRRQEIANLGYWFHNLHLPDGTQTMPDHHFGDFPNWKWQQFSSTIPKDLTDWTALDIGCNAGFYSFELAKRGATVTAIDMNPMYLDQARWAAKEFGLEDRVRLVCGQVYDLAYRDEEFDLVLFMGVFYHLRYPLLALDILAQKTRRMMVLQTLQMLDEEISPHGSSDVEFQNMGRFTEPGWPKMAFIETTFCRDPTNWWVPNCAAVLAMMRSAGMQLVRQPASDIYISAPDPNYIRPNWQLAELEAATGGDRPPFTGGRYR
jgi:tRNA (mo5U34)-methyltransferase